MPYFRRISESELQHPADVFALFLEAADAGFRPDSRTSADFAALVALAYRLGPHAPAECLRGLLSAFAWDLIEERDRAHGERWEFGGARRVPQADDDRVNRRLRERGLDHLRYF